MLIRQVFHNAVIGFYALEAEDGRLTKLEFLVSADGQPTEIESCGLSTNVDIENHALLRETNRQLEAYLSGELRDFDLPLAPHGTDFQLIVWNELSKIPYGEVCSYKDIAMRIGNPHAVRAVGSANNRNPLPIFYPCHRVIGSNGKLIGYAGGIDLKSRLLNIECSHMGTFCANT